MKRLFIVASLAIMAVGCQKTEVQNEVLTPIGFNTEVGKQTKAIIQNGTTANSAVYDQTFGVVAYLNDANASVKTYMDNIEIEKVSGEWKNTAATYYWPNDKDNTIDFYAYSPFGVDATMTSNKMTLEYALTADNYYGDNAIDFMVATPVLEATYSTVNSAEGKTGIVPVNFHHEMAQVKFAIDNTVTDATVGVKVYSITMNGTITESVYTNTLSSEFETGEWTKAKSGEILAFPLGDEGNVTNGVEITTSGKTTTPMTMIPHTPTSITVKYGITTGPTDKRVEEIIVETFDLPTGDKAWAANKSVTYKLTIGIKEIKFEPVVADWTVVADPIVLPA